MKIIIEWAFYLFISLVVGAGLLSSLYGLLKMINKYSDKKRERKKREAEVDSVLNRYLSDQK